MIIEIERQFGEKFVDHRNQSIIQTLIRNLISKLLMMDKSKKKEKNISIILKNLLSIILKSLESTLMQRYSKESI